MFFVRAGDDVCLLCGNLGLGVTACFVGWSPTMSGVASLLAVSLSSRATILRCLLVLPILLLGRPTVLKIAGVRGVVLL